MRLYQFVLVVLLGLATFVAVSYFRTPERELAEQPEVPAATSTPTQEEAPEAPKQAQEADKAPEPPPAPPKAVKAAVGAEITAANVFLAVNNERIDAGLPVLARNAALDRAAAAKLADMKRLGYWAHTSPEGKTHDTFIDAEGYPRTYSGENLARDFASTQTTVAAWMASPTHRANIVKAQYRDTGIATDGVITVQLFGTQR